MSLESVSPDDKKKLDTFIETSKSQLQTMTDIRDSLKDYAKTLAEELNIKPKELMIAARTAFKNDLADKKESMDTVETILQVTGNA